MEEGGQKPVLHFAEGNISHHVKTQLPSFNLQSSFTGIHGIHIYNYRQRGAQIPGSQSMSSLSVAAHLPFRVIL